MAFGVILLITKLVLTVLYPLVSFDDAAFIIAEPSPSVIIPNIAFFEEAFPNTGNLIVSFVTLLSYFSIASSSP